MIVYPNVPSKGSVERIEPKELVDAVFLMTSRAKEAGCKTVFFSEVGALPLKYVFQRGAIKRGSYDMDTFSSKVTAITKSPLSKQICSILTAQECNQRLTNDQVARNDPIR